MTISLRIETISVPSTPTTDSGQIDTPLERRKARGGSDPLDSAQRAAVIGDSVPIVFGRRINNAGGVLVSPPATEARFSNDASNDVTASYLLVISEGQVDGVQVRDVFQQSCRVGTYTQAFDRRAGTWGPGNFITTQTGFESQVPDCPIYCGSGTGSYAGMTTGSFVNTIPNGFTQWDRQVHVFIRGGMWVARLLEGTTGPSNNVVDLFQWALARTSRVPAALIDSAALLEAATFTNANGLLFNGLISDPTNLADWVSSTLPYFLLRESRSSGKKGLRPLLPFNANGTINTGPVPWLRTFNEDSIIPGSLSISYVPRADRMPFCVQVVWRQQPDDGLGLARTAEVRYGGSALDGPYEQHDLSEFCATEDHAFKVGAYILARRRYIDHRLTLKVRPGDLRDLLSPGDIVRVRLRRIANVGSASVHDYLYEVDRVARTAAGEVALELTHFPVDDQGQSLVARDVSQAVGNGLLLPTGRAAVNCDLNDPLDTSITVDLGPWEDWVIGISDPPLYDLDLSGSWPGGIEIDLDTGWGPGGVEFENLLFTEAGWGDWYWDADAGAWAGGVGDPPAFIDLDPADGIPDLAPENGWGVDDIGEVDLGLDGFGFGGEGGTGDAYTASIGFTQTLITYPDVFYAALEPGYAAVKFSVTVSNPPIDGPLRVTVTDGTYEEVQGAYYEVGSDSAWTLTIAEGETTSDEITIPASTNDFLGNTVISGCVTRTLAVLGWSGGGYVKQPADNSDPENPIEFAPAMDISATQDFDVCAYAGTISWGQVGIWAWDSGATEWSWAGTETEQDEPVDPTIQIVSGDWTWDIDLQQFTYTGAETDWTWNGATRTWTYIGVENPVPAAPALPPPEPDSTPAGSGYTSVVVHALVDTMPVVDDLLVELSDGNLQTFYGTLVIPGVPIMFGTNWRWVAATSEWDRLNTPSDWRWRPQDAEWEYLGTEPWEWDTANERWGSFTGDSLGWTWDAEDQSFGYADDPPEEGAPNGPPAGPPQQGGSTFPPDAAAWTYDPNLGAWIEPVSSGYALNGGPPDASPYEGFKTLHFLN